MATVIATRLPYEPAMLADVEARYPTLSCDGFGSLTPRRLRDVPEQFAVAMAFIQAGAPGVPFATRRNGGRFYSSGVKHAAERWSEETLGAHHYVSNGAMIAAAIASGWSVEPDGANAWLKPSRKPGPKRPAGTITDEIAATTAALAAVETLYRSKPRRAPTIDAYCRLWTSGTSAISSARDVLEYGPPFAPAIKHMTSWRARAERFLDKLRADPYVCKSAAKMQRWQG